MRTFYYYFIFISSLISISCEQEPSADLIITGANIWTADEQNPSANSLAISNGKILAIGKEETILKYSSSKSQKIDLAGKFLMPAFIDSHVHLMTGGRSLLSVDLRDADSPEEFSKRVGDFAESIPEGQWILEGNWDHTLWGGELPHRDWIDGWTPNTPVLLFRLDWHMALANTAALKFAGLDKHTKEVVGGSIGRDKDGELTGILKDNAMNLVMDKIPPMSEEEKDNAFDAAMAYFLSNGVASVHDVDALFEDFESYATAQKFQKSGKLNLRIYAATPLKEWESLQAGKLQKDEWIKSGSLKGFVDGSLGSHTAAFHEAYTDKADDKGFFINSEEELYEWISGADKANLHVMVHAIGDKANHVLLNIFEKVARENGTKDRRFRIEHAQHIAPEDIQRFRELGVIASMQPYHAIDDGRWAETYIGPERIKTTYAFQSLLQSGARLTFGSDWAVAPASPLKGIHAALLRQTLDGANPDGWVAEQKISLEAALKAYTIDAAFASFEEDIKGSLEVGKLADFVVLSEDLFQIDPGKIKDVLVLQTYVGGKKVFELTD